MNRREILFRGKRVDNGEWVYGSLIHRPVNVAENPSEYAAIVIFDKHADSSYNAYLELEVDPSTIGQFTGLTDKNGAKIWEGDILIVPGGAWGIVVWKAPFFEVTISETESSLYSREWLQECEVFGNRFDNPELMQS